MLLRPRTGLQDMTIELDPGTEEASRWSRTGRRSRCRRPSRNVSPTRSSPRSTATPAPTSSSCSQGGGQGLGGNGEELCGRAEALRAHGSRPREDQRQALQAPPEHRPGDHQLQARSARSWAPATPSSAEFVDSSNAVLGSFANQEASIREHAAGAALGARGDPRRARERRPARARARPRLAGADPLGAGARARAARRLARSCSRRSGRSATRSAPSRGRSQPPVRDLTKAARGARQRDPAPDRSLRRPQPPLQRASPTTRPAAEEGYLFWVALAQPQHQRRCSPSRTPSGPLLRGLVLQSCQTATNAEALTPRPTPRTFLRPSSSSPGCRPRTRSPHDPTQPAICTLDRDDSRPHSERGEPPATRRDSHPDPDRRRLHAVVLRPGAVPLDRLRRPGAAEARGLPGDGAVRRGDPARGRSPTCGSPASRSAR